MVIEPGTGENDNVYEIYLNRSGINSIEAPREKIVVETGGRLPLKFLNRGAPIHITINTPNAGMFTDFFHENLYVVDDMVLLVPIRKDSSDGFFDLDLISGYGVTKTTLRVNVVPAISRQKPAAHKEPPIQPVAHGRPHLLMIMMGIALVLYTGWLYTKTEILNLTSFIILIVGALYIWYRQR
jgi:hypothetical protein